LYQESGADFKTQSRCWIVHKHEGNRNSKWESIKGVEKKRRETKKFRRQKRKEPEEKNMPKSRTL
jgi:hypothetical protein